MIENKDEIMKNLDKNIESSMRGDRKNKERIRNLQYLKIEKRKIKV